MTRPGTTTGPHALDSGRVPVPASVRPLYDLVVREVTTRQGSRSLMLNLYLPSRADPAKPLADRPPLIVWIHGGGWRNGNRNRLHVPWLAGEGYALASIEYRLSPEAPFPAQVHDVKAAVRWLIAHAEDYGYDAGRLIVGGPSAGGHLASLLGVIAERPGVLEEEHAQFGEVPIRVSGVVCCFGPTDLAALSAWDRLGPAARDALTGLFDGPPAEHLEAMREASAATYVDARSPAFLLLHGSDDPVINPEQSRRLHERLTALGVVNELHILPGERHGGPAFFATEAARQRILGFLGQVVGPVDHGREGPAGAAAASVDRPRRPQPVIVRPADEEAPTAPDGFTVLRNIVYRVAPGQAPDNTGDLELMLDLYLPPSSGRAAPLVVFFHGGGWLEGTRRRMALGWMMDHGYAMASVEYRYSHDGPFPAQLWDARAAIRWLRAHAEDYGYDADGIVAAGTSAGGTLAGLLATSDGVKELEGDDGRGAGWAEVSGRVNAALTFYGPCDFTYFAEQGYPAPVTRRAVEGLLGGPIEARAELARLASAGAHASPDDAPVFVCHGEADPIVPAEISRRLYRQLTEAGVQAELVILPKGGHGGPPDVFWMNEAFRRRIITFLDTHLKQAPAGSD